MTIRDAFENCLIELNKVQAPTLLIGDFIYFFNKAIQQYVNERYMLFESKQQITDDLRVLLKSKKIIPDSETEESVGSGYEVSLPDDYLHILNCVCEFEDKNPNCNDKSLIQQGANKIDTSQWPHIINNYYMKPSIKRPYYYIMNISDPKKQDTNSLSLSERNDIVQAGAEQRYGNSTKPIMQIKCGDNPRYTLRAVYVDYLRAPQYLSIDQELLDKIEDETQIIEFPDYVIYEIINKIVLLCMENQNNPRIQTNVQVNPPLK